MRTSIRLIGIDPGLRITGWGLVDVDGPRLSYVASGTIRPDPAADLGHRLRELSDSLDAVLGQFEPNEAAVEETFVNTNARSALKLGQARGVCMLSPARAGLPVSEYAANAIKKAVVGAGHAGKDQVAAMVGRLLPQAPKLSADEADALAVAICHASFRRMPTKVSA